MTDTLNKLRSLVQADVESYPIADAIAAYCATKKPGSQVSERDTKALEAANPGYQFRLYRDKGAFGKTSITGWQDLNPDNTSNYERTRTEIRIFPSGTGAVWPTVEQLKQDSSNARFFRYKDERNAERATTLTDESKAQGLKKVADLTDAFALLHQELKAALEEYNLDEASVSYKVREIIKEATGEEVKFY